MKLGLVPELYGSGGGKWEGEAADKFNAGVVYGLLVAGVTFEDLKNGISEDKWDIVVKSAIDFSSLVCTTLDNYAPKDFCEEYSRQNPIPVAEE